MAATTLTDRALLRLSGVGARDFLQGLVTSDVTGPLPVWAALLSAQGKCLFDFIIWERATTCSSIARPTRPRSWRSGCRSTACGDRSGSSATKRSRCIGRWMVTKASRTTPCPLGHRWLGTPAEAASGWLGTSPAPRGLRGAGRARRHPVARMQCGRAQRRQLLQGLLRRTGEHRPDELAAEGQPPAGRGRAR